MAIQANNQQGELQSIIEAQERERKLITYLEKKINKLKQLRAPWEKIWKDVAECVDPYSWVSPYCNERSKQMSRGRKFKSATIAEAYDAITALETTLCSKAVRWAGIDINSVNAKGIENSKIWQNFRNDSLLSGFYKITDNYKRQFYESNHKLFTEAFLYGTACRHIKWTNVGEGLSKQDSMNMPVAEISFDCPPINRILFEKNGFNEIVFAAQEMKITIGTAASAWGMENITNTFNITSIEQYYAQEDEDKEFIHVVMERGPYNNDYPATRFVGYIISLQSRKIVANIEDINEMPYNIFRLWNSAGEYYGRTPLFYMIEDMIYCDELLEQFRDAAEIAIRPPILLAAEAEIPEGGILPGCLIPGGLDPLTRQTSLQRLDLGAGVQISKDVIDMKRREIHDNMLFGNMLSPQETAGMTETQVCELRIAHDNRMSPIATSWQSDDMYPTCKHILKYLFHPRGGRLQFPYKELGLDETVITDPLNMLEIIYTGLLGREQKKHDNLQITGIVSEALNWSQADPNVMDKVDFDKAFDVKLKNLDLPDTIQREEKEIQQIREARQQAQEEEKNKQEYIQGIEIATKIAQGRERQRSQLVGGR